MTKQEIYNALDPSWWVLSTPNNWQTTFYSTEILYSTTALPSCSYISSAPFTTGGLSSGTTAPQSQVDAFIDILRLEAAQRLHDMHATDITGHTNLGSVYNATA